MEELQTPLLNFVKFGEFLIPEITTEVLFREQLEEFVPHRGDRLIIDSFVNGREKFGRLYLDKNWQIFKDHFPDKPMFPNDMLDEFFCISAAIYFRITMSKINGFPAVARKDGIAYKASALPGDYLTAHPKLEKNLRNKFFIFSGYIANAHGIVATYEKITGAPA